MLSILFLIYAFHCIRKLILGNLSWHCISCGGDDEDEGDRRSEYEAAVTPARQYQADMSALFKQVYEPYVRDISGLWSQYGKPITAAESQYYLETGLPQKQALTTAGYEDYMNLMRPYLQGQFGLYNQYGRPLEEERLKQAGEVFLPAQRELGGRLRADVQNPWLDTRPIFDKIWQQTRERTAAEWLPIEQRTSQRLAGADALESGAALKAGTDIELGKYKFLETQAIDMALQEFNIQAKQKQLSYENMFRYLGGQPGGMNLPTINPAVTQQPTYDMSTIGQVGQWRPEVIPPYIQQPQQKTNLGGLGTGLGALGAMGLAALSPTIPFTMPLLIGGMAAGGGIGSLIKY